LPKMFRDKGLNYKMETTERLKSYTNMSTLREQAKAYVNAMSDDELESMIVRAHATNSHKWVECMPDGTVHETEEADNNTTHWIDYPRKAVATIYNIANECAGACNCDTCTMYRQLTECDEEEWVERWGQDALDYCKTYTLEQALLDDAREAGISSETIREQMLDAIDELEHGYFNDEDA